MNLGLERVLPKMVKATKKVIVSLYGRARGWLSEPSPRGQTLPPYILIAVLWFLNGVADDRAREADLRQARIQSAVVEYQNRREIFSAQREARQNCINSVEGRNNNISNWKDLFTFLVPFNAEFAAQLEEDFDSKERNQPTTVEVFCANVPEPQPVVIPPILIEEGIIEP